MSQPTDKTIHESERMRRLAEKDRHRLLASPRRRVILKVLAEQSSTLTLEELATAVATREKGSVDEEVVETVAVSLHHAHLPKMARVGVLTYDPDTHHIDGHREFITI